MVRIPPYLDGPLTHNKKISSYLIEKHTTKIIYEDNNYIVTNKNNDIAVHAGSKNGIGLIDIFRSKFGNHIELCHRLDKQTSGCLVLAKNKKSVKYFSNLLSTNDTKKTYIAILQGKFKDKKIIENEIYKNNILKLKKSKTIFKLVRQLKNTSIVNVDLHTGRTHQIRIHASQINHPILFDKKYGDKMFDNSINLNFKKTLALHSKSISFKDQNSKIIKASASYPDEFKKLIKALK